MDDETLRKIDLDQLQAEKEVLEELLSTFPNNSRYLRECLDEINQTIRRLTQVNGEKESSL